MHLRSLLIRLNIVCIVTFTSLLLFWGRTGSCQSTPAYSFIDKDWISLSIQQGFYTDGNRRYDVYPGHADVITGVSSDGDPSGSSLMITTHVASWSSNSIDGMTSTATGYALDATHVYDPSVSGAIDKLDISVSSVVDSSWTGWGDQNIGDFQGNGFVLMQNDNTYIYDHGWTTPGSWTDESFVGATASDFSLWGPDAFQTQAIHPDFSSTGGAIIFGFTGSNSTANYGGERGTSTYFDDFAVKIYGAAVPEPNAGIMLLSGIPVATILFHLRHKRSPKE